MKVPNIQNWRVAESRRRIKKRAVEYKGGKCIECGYSKCIAALEFHHRDPSGKDFQMSSGKVKNWEANKVELDKCDLLCCRCHREVHDAWKQADREKQQEALQMKALRPAVMTRCGKCRKPVKVHQSRLESRKEIFCSVKCSSSAQERVSWPSDVKLRKLIESGSYRSVAVKLGVSDKAVRKRFLSRCA